MDINRLMIESLQLLGLGMGAVFIILISLIVIITLVAKAVPEELPTAAGVSAQGVKNDHIAAIAAAIQQYRKSR